MFFSSCMQLLFLKLPVARNTEKYGGNFMESMSRFDAVFQTDNFRSIQGRFIVENSWFILFCVAVLFAIFTLFFLFRSKSNILPNVREVNVLERFEVGCYVLIPSFRCRYQVITNTNSKSDWSIKVSAQFKSHRPFQWCTSACLWVLCWIYFDLAWTNI